MEHSKDDWDKPQRERPLAALAGLFAQLPRRTLWKVGTLLLLLAAVIYFRSRADTVVQLFGPQGLQPAAPHRAPAVGEKNQRLSGGGIPADSVPSSPR